jgi:hypothetical protein
MTLKLQFQLASAASASAALRSTVCARLTTPHLTSPHHISSHQLNANTPSWQVAYVWAFITKFGLMPKIRGLESLEE